MKFTAHLGAIAIGLVVGLTVRASMRGDAAADASEEEVVSILSNTRRAGASQVADILSQIEERPLTGPREASVQVAILDLREKHFPEMARKLLVNWEDHKTALDALFSAWGEVAPLDALAMIEELPKRYRKRAKYHVIDAWVLTDADGAFAHVNQGPRKSAQFISTTKDARLWRVLTQADPHEALARAERIADAEERREREDDIMGSLSHRDPQSAVEWLEANRDGPAQKKALPDILHGWAVSEPRRAFDYLVTLDEEVQSGEAYEKLGRGLSQELATALRDSVPDKYRDTFWGSYVESHADLNPAAAAALAESLPEAWPRQSALSVIATQWAFVNLEATGEWVSSLARSRSRDFAISSFAHQLMTTDPEAGVSWFADMDHERDRSIHLGNALLSWLRKDHAAASAWMDAQSTERLPEKMKAEVLEAVPQ